MYFVERHVVSLSRGEIFMGKKQDGFSDFPVLNVKRTVLVVLESPVQVSCADEVRYVVFPTKKAKKIIRSGATGSSCRENNHRKSIFRLFRTAQLRAHSRSLTWTYDSALLLAPNCRTTANPRKRGAGGNFGADK